MSRIKPAPPDESGNVVTNSLLSRVLGRRPEILKAFARMDAATRFHGLLPTSLKETIRQATAGHVGCDYCESLGAHGDTSNDRRASLATSFARTIAADPRGITDSQFDVLRAEFTEEEIIELVAFVCLVGIAGQMFGAVMGLEPASAEEAAAHQSVVADHG